MLESPLSRWQAQFFSERVRTRSSGADGVYFREQVFGALDVLSDALPDLQSTLGEENFRFFVRELLQNVQPKDALGTSLVEPFLCFVLSRPELSQSPSELALVRTTLERVRANSAPV